MGKKHSEHLNNSILMRNRHLEHPSNWIAMNSRQQEIRTLRTHAFTNTQNSLATE